MKKVIDWSKFETKAPGDYTHEELHFEPAPESAPKWKIPEKVCIQATISGGGPRLTNKQNPNQPSNLDDIRDSAEECIKAGASVVHFDNMLPACHTRDGKEIPVGESYTYVVKPLLAKYGREKLCPHINILRGDFQQQMLPVVNGLAEISYINPSNSPRWMRTCLGFFKEYNIKAEIVIHTTSKIDFGERELIRTGLMPNPNLWIILPAAQPRPPGGQYEYMPNERKMCQALLLIVDEIKEIDPEAFIVVCCAGRPTRYLTTLALLMGLHIRVGMEDTVFKYPHKDEKIRNNAEEVREAIEIARLLGREAMTPNEYRQAVGLKPRFDFLPEGMK